MATSVVFTNPFIVCSTTSVFTAIDDIAAMCSKVGLSRKFDLKDDTVFGMTAHSQKAGLEKWEIDISAIMSFTSAAGNNNIRTILSKLSDISSTGSFFWAEVRPVNACSSVNNPRFFGPVIIDGYSPIDGKIGDILMTNFKFVSAGNFNQASSS